MVQVDEAHAAGKYLFIWDKSDQIDTFFKYKGMLCDFFFFHMQVENERATVDQAIEKLRDSFIKAGRQGAKLLINLDEHAPDLAGVYSKPEYFDTSIAFNKNEWIKPEVHTAALQEGENYSGENGSGGLYFMMPEFSMQVRSTAPDAEKIIEVLSKIPNNDQFNCIIIE